MTPVYETLIRVILDAFPGRLPGARNSVELLYVLKQTNTLLLCFFTQSQLLLLATKNPDTKCAPLRGRRELDPGLALDPGLLKGTLILIFSLKWGPSP